MRGETKGHVFRVQDHSGRGPYQPGLSSKWTDPDGPICKPWWVELGMTVTEAILMMPDRMHIGCAFASLDKLHKWFTPAEMARLDKLSFYIVSFRPSRIIAETPTQLVFAHRTPLFGLPKLSRCIARAAA